jgi:hypothetical protein
MTTFEPLRAKQAAPAEKVKVTLLLIVVGRGSASLIQINKKGE